MAVKQRPIVFSTVKSAIMTFLRGRNIRAILNPGRGGRFRSRPRVFPGSFDSSPFLAKAAETKVFSRIAIFFTKIAPSPVLRPIGEPVIFFTNPWIREEGTALRTILNR